MRIHGSGGYPGGGPQANWKQDKQNTSNPATADQGNGNGWGNWKDKGQGDQFQSSFDVSQQGNNDSHCSWSGHGGRRAHSQGGNPFKTDSTQAPTPTPTPSDATAGNAGDAANYLPSPVPAPSPSSGNYGGNYGNPSATPSGSPSGSPSSSPIGSTSTGNPFNGGKEGLGVSDTSSNGDGSNLGSTKASWYYNWSPNASSKVNDPNATFIPMIWGQKNMNPQDLQAAAKSNSPMLLTFNEPDLPSQANMTPEQALADWSQLEATGKKLSSPAISNGPDGIKWLDQFMAGASAAGHRVDSISLHWYGSSSQSADQNVASLKDHIEQVHNKYPNLPINLTEFGVDASGLTAGKDQDFLAGAEKMLNDLPYVQMYSPYGLGTTNGN